MNFIEASEAFEEAAKTFRAVDHISEKMAIMLVGRLRTASNTYRGANACERLKKELRKFNAKTHQWKD